MRPAQQCDARADGALRMCARCRHLLTRRSTGKQKRREGEQDVGGANETDRDREKSHYESKGCYALRPCKAPNLVNAGTGSYARPCLFGHKNARVATSQATIQATRHTCLYSRQPSEAQHWLPLPLYPQSVSCADVVRALLNCQQRHAHAFLLVELRRVAL